jgi:TrpR family trp operon transcriptional repressor
METKESEEGWQRFLHLCTRVKTPALLDELFALFFTWEERETIGKRHLIVEQLERGERTQREIAEECHVSISQITRGSNALKIISDDLRTWLKAHSEER